MSACSHVGWRHESQPMPPAEEIAAAPALAMRLTKQCVDQGSKTDLTNGIAIEMAAIRQVLEASDWRDGLKRFETIVGAGKSQAENG